MAKKKPVRGVRSQAIRDYLSQNPKATPKEIVAGLKEKGIGVSLGLASIVKYKNKPAKVRGRRASRNGKQPQTAVTAADLMAVKTLADSVGGIENARQALALLEQLR